MPEKHFGKLVDDYLANRISPDELKWLRQKVNTDEDCRNLFQRKCNQHQVSQYRMGQQAPPSKWELEQVPEEPVSSIHMPAPETREDIGLEERLEDEIDLEVPTFRFRDFVDFSVISGLACITVVILVCWLDRNRIFGPNFPGYNGQTSIPEEATKTKMDFSPGAYHNLITPVAEVQSGNTENRDWLNTHQLAWYLRNQFPQSAPLDLDHLEHLQQNWELHPETFPHSILIKKTFFP